MPTNISFKESWDKTEDPAALVLCLSEKKRKGASFVSIPTFGLPQQREFHHAEAYSLRWSPSILRGSQSIFQSSSLEIGPIPQSATNVSISLDIEQLLQSLAEEVYLKHADEIREYLLQFTDLVNVIPVAVEAARRHFPDAQLVLGVYRDPEIEDCHLIIYVRLREYDDSVIERLEKAEAEFLDDLVGKEGWILLTTDFMEPEGEEENAL